jgi:hypothetical protein
MLVAPFNAFEQAGAQSLSLTQQIPPVKTPMMFIMTFTDSLHG